MADGVNIATAYVQIMPSVEGIQGNLTNALAPAAATAGATAGAQGGSALGVGLIAAMKKRLAPVAIGAGLVAGFKGLGGAFLNIGKEFDEMTDSIVIGTGASGEALDGLVDSAAQIASTVPVSFAQAGDYVQNLNTRMGLLGDNLEDVGERTAALGQLFGKDINLDKLTGALNAFGVSNDEAAAKMDYLFGVSQATGISFDSLTGVLETNAPTLQNLGFSFEEAANMAGLLDKAGMDASSTMSKMSKALVTVAEPGEDAAAAYRRVVSELGDFIEAGDTASALNLASEIFGTKGAAQFVGALQSGALSLEQIEDAALGASDGIMGTYAATMDYPDQLTLIENKAKKAFEPMGGAMMEAAMKALTRIGELLDGMDSEQLEHMADVLGRALVDGVDAAAVAIDFFVEHYDEIKDFGDKAFAVFEFLRSPLPMLTTDFTGAGSILENVASGITGAFDTMAQGVGGAIETAKGFITGLPDAVASIPGRVVAFFQGLGQRITSAIGSIHFPTPHVSWETLEVFGMSTPVRLPHVSWYATGGWIDSPTILAGVGEKGGEFVFPSYQPYLSIYAKAIAEQMPVAQGAAAGPNIYVDGSAILASPMLENSFMAFMEALRKDALQNVR